MCGLSGILNYAHYLEPSEVSALIKEINRKATHRGPDDEGYWQDDAGLISLGHRRLSIIDLSVNGRQPMVDHSGRYVGIVNGEIYNYKFLRDLLEVEGVTFKSDSDSEVFINLFAAYGDHALQLVDGQFAVAIYDTSEKCLLLARDAAGEKPLYFVRNEKVFAFASELSQLFVLSPKLISLELSEEALTQYFMLRYVPAPNTVLSNVSKLEPGALLRIDKYGEVSTRRWFEFDIDANFELDPRQSLDDAADEVEELLARSISNRLVSDVPLGIFLSGGVDSSLVAAIASKKLDRQVQTFSCGFEKDPKSEHLVAQSTAKMLGTEHQAKVLSSTDFDQLIDSIGYALDEPNGDRSCIPTRLLSGFTKDFVTVALSGDGGDELFAGYGRYLAFGDGAFDPLRIDARKVVESYFQTCLPVFPLSSIRLFFEKSHLVVEEFLAAMQPMFMHPGRTFIDSLRLTDFHTYLPGAVLSKVDRMSMQVSLEVRSPFLSRNLMAWAMRSSQGYLVEGQVQKKVLRRVLSRYLPESVTNAPKMGFGMPASVFSNNKDRVEREMKQSFEILKDTTFFRERQDSLDRISGVARGGINSIWAYIVLAKWMYSHNIDK